MKLLIGITILNVGLIIAPLVVALPPIRQTPAMLTGAHAAQMVAPIWSLAVLSVLAISLWQRRTWGKLALLVIVLSCTALSRVNLLEGS